MHILVVMDPISQIHLKKDSTIAMLWAAKRRGHSLYYAQLGDLYLQDGRAFGHICPLDVFENSASYYYLAAAAATPLGTFDVILMRKDPPFDMRYIYSTYILEQAERDGAWVVNRPQSLRDCNEKLFATQFSELMTPTLVSANMGQLREFITQHGDVIVKPLDGMGGSGIFRLTTDSPNTSSTLEMLTELGKWPIMAQRYIPEISVGDKRILLINGQPVDYCLARIPATGETRGNLAAGGTGVAQPLSNTDRMLAERVGPVLREKGLFFVGLDVIGDYITEINVTSPTCLREIEAAYPVHIADDLIQFLEQGRP